MNYKDYIIEETVKSMESLFRNVRAMPDDKLMWKVEGKGRTVIDQLQECATSPHTFIRFLNNEEVGPKLWESLKEQQAAWITIDMCEEHAKKNTGELLDLIGDFPEESLYDKVTLPFGDGYETTYADVMSYQNWHFAYHDAQISFIQTLYGDMAMH
jgi:uncharacterized damage-inducible protein DinB